MKRTHLLYKTLLGLTLFAGISCSKSTLSDINTDPNRPALVTTPTLLITAEKQLINALRSEEISLRGAQLFTQYFSQNIYTDQSRYQIPTSYSDNYWTATYKALNNLNEIIKLNSSESTKAIAAADTAGTNTNQIAIARILKSYAFHSLTDVFGNIPYQSYGNTDPDFEALQQDPDNLTPKYASQEKIYKDILNELQQAADTLIKYQSEKTFGTFDVIYKGTRYDDKSRYERVPTDWVSHNNLEDFLGTGLITENNATVSYRSEKVSIFGSGKYAFQKGQVPNTKY